MRWSDLSPDARILAALDHAGLRPESGSQDEKRDWSDKFADGCAIAIASELRRCKGLGRKRKILPDTISKGTEPLTPLGGGTKKRIDVTVADPVLGLELGFSLKGLNFRDVGNGNFDKNLTGRLYEIGDEARMVHEHLPHALLVGVFFLPLDSTTDKKNSHSSFAHTVAKLRDRTGRLDFALAGQASRCDSSWVCLYTTGSETQAFPKGLARFFNVEDPPPKRGRPKIEQTKSLTEMVEFVVALATHESSRTYSESESEAGSPSGESVSEPSPDEYLEDPDDNDELDES